MYVEEWLETLPFADFERTTQLLHAAIAATNPLSLKPVARQALLAGHGQLTANQTLDIETSDSHHPTRTRQLIEELAGFEQFTMQPDWPRRPLQWFPVPLSSGTGA